MTYRATMQNSEGMTFQVNSVACTLERDVPKISEEIMNSHPDHKKYGPWQCISTMRQA